MIDRSSRPPSEYTWYCLTSGLTNLHGRARRAEFGSFLVFSTVYLSTASGIQFGLLSASGPLARVGSLIVGLATFWILLALTAASIRRLHDIGRSGWFVLLAAVPVVGIVLAVTGALIDGQRDPNRYGESPKYRDSVQADREAARVSD